MPFGHLVEVAHCSITNSDERGIETMNLEIHFQPVIIGTDLNAYGVARTFHMAYGVVSKIFGNKKLLMVDHSKICDVTEVEGFTQDAVMVHTLIQYAKEHPEKKLILFAASEQYVFRILSHYTALQDYYIIPYTKPELGLLLSDKMNFYEYCETYQLAYPKALEIKRETYEEFTTDLSFPLVLKPSESSDYFDLSFEGKEKAYILQDASALKKALKDIYGHGYGHNMILQEYVAGDVSNEYVMNVYADQKGKVRLMSLGRILIEDPQPDMRGNYVAIVSPQKDPRVTKLYEDIKRFLETIEFTGIANFDFKVDDKDGLFKVFEINMRQGRSSFFSTLAGANLAVPIVEDLVFGKALEGTLYGADPFIWTNCFDKTFFRLVKTYQPALYDELISMENIGNTLFYAEDLSLRRKMLLNKYFKRYDERLSDFYKSRK